MNTADMVLLVGMVGLVATGHGISACVLLAIAVILGY